MIDPVGASAGAIAAIENAAWVTHDSSITSIHAYALVTSTSTVLVDGPTSWGGLWLMFGVDYWAVASSTTTYGPFSFGTSALDTEEFGYESVWASTFSAGIGVAAWTTFIVSDEQRGTFDIYSGGAYSGAYYAFHQTRVPKYRLVNASSGDGNFGYDYISYDDTSSTGVVVGAGGLESLGPIIGIVYKDPFVLHVQTGGAADGWWMFLSRYRTSATDPPSSTSEPPNIPDTGPEYALGDIVAFWSASPQFRSDDVKGPYRIVASTECTNVAPAGSGIRFWCGTSGAVVVTSAMSGDSEDWLYVYYVVQKSSALLGDIDDRGVTIGVVENDNRLDSIMETLAVTAGIETVEGVWVRRIPLADLGSALNDSTSFGEEASWGDLGVPTGLVAEGNVLGQVRIFSAQDLSDSLASTGAPGEDILQKNPGASVPLFWADPAPIVGQNESLDDVLALFVAGIPSPTIETDLLADPSSGVTPDDPFGVIADTSSAAADAESYVGAWACVAVDASTCRSFGLTYGTAFTVRTKRLDRVKPEGHTGAGVPIFPLDPDPVVGATGTGVQVYVGQQDSYGTSYPLEVYTNDATEVFRAWDKIS